MSKPSRSRDLVFKIFSEHSTSFRETKNRPPLICRYCPYRLSRGSLWNLAVRTKSYPSLKRSSMSEAWHRKVRFSAELVCADSVNLGNFISSHSSNQSAKARRNCGFPSSGTAALPRRLWELKRCLELEMVNQRLKLSKTLPRHLSPGNDTEWQLMLTPQISPRQRVNSACMKFPGCNTFDVIFGAAFRWAASSASFSCTFNGFYCVDLTSGYLL